MIASRPLAVLCRIGITALVLAAPAQAGQTSAPPIPTPLTYQAALDVAISRNLSVGAARGQRAIREAAIRAARQIPNPVTSLELSRDTPHETFGIDLPIELGGKRARRIDLATQELALADVDVQTELRTMRHNLRQTFYGLIAADEQLESAEAVLDIARRIRDAAQARFDTGAAPRLEVLQADLGVTRAETDAALARSVRVAAQASLNAVLNIPPAQAVVLSGHLSDHRSTITYPQALALAAASNVDLLGLDRELAVEERRGALLRAERLPTPVFSFKSLFNSPDFDTAQSGAVSIEVPLFSRNQGEIAGSLAAGAALRLKRAAVQRDVDNSVFGAVARIDAERQQVEAYEQRLVPTATDLERLAEESYRAGRTSVLSVFDAQRSLRDLRRDALQAALDLQMLLADLEELLGTPLP